MKKILLVVFVIISGFLYGDTQEEKKQENASNIDSYIFPGQVLFLYFESEGIIAKQIDEGFDKLALIKYVQEKEREYGRFKDVQVVFGSQRAYTNFYYSSFLLLVFLLGLLADFFYRKHPRKYQDWFQENSFNENEL